MAVLGRLELWKKKGYFQYNREKINGRVLLAFLFSFTFCVCLAYYLYTKAAFRYAINDDYAFNLMLSGAYGRADGYDVFQNVIWGKFISSLYMFFPSANWYAITMLGMFCLSFALYGTLIIDKFGHIIGIPLVIMADLIFETSLLYMFQWTICSYLCACTGIALFVNGHCSLKVKRKFDFILSILFIATAFMIRWNVIIPTAILICAYWVVIFFRDKKAAIKSISALCVMAGVIIALYAVNLFAYNVDPQWHAYESYNTVRSDLVDYSTSNYDSIKKTYQSIGWTKNDCQVFWSFITPDEGKFSTENLNKISDAIGKNYDLNITDVASTVKANILLQNHTLVACIVILLAFAMAEYFNKDKILPVGLVASAVLFHATFVVIHRDLDRIVYPQYVVTALLLIYIIDFNAFKDGIGIDPEKIQTKTRVGLFMLLLLAAMAIPSIYEKDQVNSARSRYPVMPKNSSIVLYDQYVKNNPQNVYVMAPNCLFQRNNYYSIFRTPPKNSLINAYPLGGWEQRTKYYYDFKKRNNINNILSDLLEKDNYYISPLAFERIIATYMYENYGVHVQFHTVYKAGDIKICKLQRVS